MSAKRAAGPARKVAPWLVGAAPLVVFAAALLWPRGPRESTPGLSKPGAATKPPEHFDREEPGRGRMARHPHQIPPRGWKDVLWRTYHEVSQDRLTVVAAGVTFYSLLAIFPAIGVFVSLYGLIADVGEVHRQLNTFSLVIPHEVLAVVGDQLTRLASGPPAGLSAAFLISLAISVWSANAGMKALFNGLNVAYDETEKRNFFTLSLLTYGFTAGALFFLTVIAAVLVAAPLYFKQWGWSDTFQLWIPLRWMVLLVFTAGVFAIVYRYGPCRARARWRWVTWGGLFSALLWLGGSLGFSWYVNHVAHFNVTYGSLGAAVGFMMWIWFSVMVVLVGAELNAEIEHQTAIDSTTGAPRPLGQRGAAMADSVGLALKVSLRHGLVKAWQDVHRQTSAVVRQAQRRPRRTADDKLKAS